MLLHKDAEVGEEGEHDVHELLVVPLVVGVVAVGHGGEERVEERERVVYLSALYHDRHLGDGGVAHCRAGGEIVGQQAAEQTNPHLLVWKAESIEFGLWVVALDGDVATLVEQWHDGGHGLGGGIEVVLAHLNRLTKVYWRETELTHHVEQIGGSA